ncbi:Smr/MutS family protein [Nitrogeniibacter aestuarii]|uniref:Smr/MutS family protein n=1 Tax=Nitrogeniibacter aestuarii TaxID=2815343 RepID=UPI001D107746|nr:Smr/MutS family protein [Nitrogeniibacter aestuarii]
MTKKRRTPPATGERPARLADNRFASLKQLKANAAQPAARPQVRKTTPKAQAERSEDDEAALFRAAVAGAQPLDNLNRAEIETTRPAPVPRQPQPDEQDTPAQTPGRPPPPADESAWFRHMMHDVSPLPDRNLAEDDGSAKPDPGELPAPKEVLDPEDVLGWLALGTQPLKDRNRIEVEPLPPVPAPRQHEADQRAVLEESLDAFSLEDRLDIGEEAVFLRPGIPRRVLADLRRGRWVVQGEIDLHGLTRDEARGALGEFLARALIKGWRCVRVVHGKGLRSPGKVGVLKHLSRGWLAQREEILAFCQARAHEGGGGALRVLLRAADKRTR